MLNHMINEKISAKKVIMVIIMNSNKMRAAVYTKYGPPDVLELKKVQKPTPKDDEILIKIQAASTNVADWRLMRASPFLVRFMGGGILRPKHEILGTDVSGTVESVGGNVKQFQPGDEVIANLSESGRGGFAEYTCALEGDVVLKPATITFEEASAVTIAAITALQGLRDYGKIQKGQKVLINGAAGGVGTFAVQIAKSYGAEVTAVCSTQNLEMVRSIGADHVIDYLQEDYTKNGLVYDLIFDAVANHTVSENKRVLNQQGICVVVGFSTIWHMFKVMWASLTSKKAHQKICSMTVALNKEDMVFIKELMEVGKVKTVIDSSFPLTEVPEALRYLEEGHAHGKVVILMDHKKTHQISGGN